jgi:hypothetical protein
MQLSDLIGNPESPTGSPSHASSCVVVLRGKPVELRLTSALTQARLESAMPRPRAPMIQDPNRGSLAPPVPDENNPEYVAAMEERARRMQIAEVAIAMDFEVPRPGDLLEGTRRWTDCQSVADREAWASAAIDVLGSALTQTEIGMARAEMARTLMKLLPQEALGN